MSTNKMLKISTIAVIASAGMSMTACANGHTNSRYGNVHDYESSQNCQQPCTPAQAAPAASSRYGSTATTAPGPVYIDCNVPGACAQPAPVYAQPTTVYTQPAPVQSYQTQSYTAPATTYAAPVNCPAGTTAQPDGTCMQGGGFVGGVTLPETFAQGSTYSSATTSYAEPVNCPAGTTAQPDGTCMQGSSYSSSASTTSSYGSSSYDSGSSYSSSSYSSVSSEPVNCPAGTTAQSDGTCMQGGSSSYADSSVEIYTGDASTSSSTPSYGYTSDGAYGATDYLPIRK